jgi:Protein of unknown function (DUF1559).
MGDTGSAVYSSETNFTNTAFGGMNTRGAFIYGHSKIVKFGSVTDGLSNSIFVSEAAISDYNGTADIPVKGAVAMSSAGVNMDPGQSRSTCLATVSGGVAILALDVNGTAGGNGIGRRWMDGGTGYSAFVTAVPPNGPSCQRGTGTSNAESAVPTASSFHTGGVNAMFGDGSVHFISDTINASNNPATDIFIGYGNSGMSPWGVWGALGTIACKESKSL